MKRWQCSICLTEYPISKRTCDDCETCFGRLDYNEMVYCRKCTVKYKPTVLKCKICKCQVARRSWTNPLRPSMVNRGKMTVEQIRANTKSTYKTAKMILQ